MFDTLEIDQGLGMKISGEHRSEELARGCKDELVGRDLLVPLADQGDIREVGVRKEMFQGVWSAGGELVPRYCQLFVVHLSPVHCIGRML